MVPVLGAVPNFSVGRDPALVERLVRTASEKGADVLDASADVDHNRAVLTLAGPTEAVEDASVAMAGVAAEAIDLRDHRGVHPRIGALDVLPFVPLTGIGMEEAKMAAHRVGERIADEVGVPVFFYALSSHPPGRGLAELRAGGFEALVEGFPPGRTPDLLPPGWPHPGIHPTAGATCVGARPLLLAWNVEVDGVQKAELERVAAELRERDGGPAGVRVLVFHLESRGRMQVSMNLEDVRNRKPFAIFRALEDRVLAKGGRVIATEVVGLIPDELVFDAAADRLSLLDPDPDRVLSSRLSAHVARRVDGATEAFLEAVRASRDRVPDGVRRAAEDIRRNLGG
jgi:glutamate formiminotransferase